MHRCNQGNVGALWVYQLPAGQPYEIPMAQPCQGQPGAGFKEG